MVEAVDGSMKVLCAMVLPNSLLWTIGSQSGRALGPELTRALHYELLYKKPQAPGWYEQSLRFTLAFIPATWPGPSLLARISRDPHLSTHYQFAKR